MGMRGEFVALVEIGDYLVACDPGYLEGDRGFHKFPAVPGDWHVYVEKRDDLPVCLSAVLGAEDPTYTGRELEEEFNWDPYDDFGVDSGNMCVWDWTDYPADDCHYQDITDDTTSGDFIHIDNCGVACRTYAGDGEYDGTAFVNDDGLLVGIEIVIG